MAEDNLLSRIKAGDEEAFEFTYTKYFNRLCVLSKKIVCDPAIAEDIVQNFFFRLWVERANIKDISNCGGYIARSIYNLSLQHIRRINTHSKHHSNIYDESFSSSEYYDQMMEIAADDRNIEMLHEAINSLPDQCQTIVKMSRYDNKRSAEIAEELNLSVRTVENHIYNGMKKIKLYLKDKLTEY